MASWSTFIFKSAEQTLSTTLATPQQLQEPSNHPEYPSNQLATL